MPSLVVRRSTIYANLNGTVGTDTGWSNLTLINGFTAGTIGGGYSGVRVRNINGHVFIQGSVSGIGGRQFTTIPSGYLPRQDVHVLSPMTGNRIARIGLNGTTGAIYIDWVKNISDGSDVTTQMSWIQVNLDYWID